MPNNDHNQKTTDKLYIQGKNNYNGSDLPTMEMEYAQRHAPRPETQQAKQEISIETSGISAEETPVRGPDRTKG